MLNRSNLLKTNSKQCQMKFKAFMKKKFVYLNVWQIRKLINNKFKFMFFFFFLLYAYERTEKF